MTYTAACGGLKIVTKQFRHASLEAGRGKTTMGIAELGALGEFVGSIAVLATLIYLSVQVR